MSENLDYFCDCKSKTSNVYNSVEGHCHQAIKIMHHHANGNINPSREAISIMSGKYKRFTFVDPVHLMTFSEFSEHVNMCFTGTPVLKVLTQYPLIS